MGARAPTGGTARSATYDSGVRGRLLTAPGAKTSNGVLMWLHGGGFVSGSPRVEQGLVARYSALSGLPAFMPRYRLAPNIPSQPPPTAHPPAAPW